MQSNRLTNCKTDDSGIFFLLSIDAMGWVGLSVLLSITSDTLSFQMNFAVFAISMTLLLLPSF